MSTVLITGAARGLGLDFTKQYAAKGWKVHGLRAQRLDELEGRSRATSIATRSRSPTTPR